MTDDGEQILVEVKVHPSEGTFNAQFKVSDGSLQKLRRYAAVSGAELYIAIFWEGINSWTLNRLGAFTAGTAGERKWSIRYPRAMATSEMALLGDRTVATAAPMRFRVLVDPARSDPIPPGARGTFKVTLRGIQLLSQDRLLDGVAAQIAWRLLQHGNWDEVGQESHHDGNRLLWVDHLMGPPGWDDDPPDPDAPAWVGSLSEMISRAYLRGAQRTIHTTATGGVLEPGFMGSFIPADFASTNAALPLWILELRANHEFDNDHIESDGQ